MVVFVLIVVIGCGDRINRIYLGVLNCIALQMKDNSNDTEKSGMKFWGKKEELFEITGIYWNLKIFHEEIPLGVMTTNSPLGKGFTLQKCWSSNIFTG